VGDQRRVDCLRIAARSGNLLAAARRPCYTRGVHFGSDNHTGASARVLETLVTANAGHTHGYGDDEWTRRATASLAAIFEREIDVFYVATGTASNTLALACLVQPWQSILCHSQAHILLDESTAPEHQTGGARPIGISGRDGKLIAEHLGAYFAAAGTDAPHNPRPGALSLAQSSELGLVYSPDELGALTEVARAHGLAVHMDGARFANAVAATGRSPADLTWRAGVDVLSLGGTKNGCLAAEAIVCFRPDLAGTLPFRRKRAGHLLSKGRLLGAQFVAWLADDHWLTLAAHANAQASRLAAALTELPGVRLVWPPQANELFAVLPTSLAQALRAAGAEFYDWYKDSLPAGLSLGEGETFVRLVTSFATEDGDVLAFLTTARTALGAR
jgi:threonine aldolase